MSDKFRYRISRFRYSADRGNKLSQAQITSARTPYHKKFIHIAYLLIILILVNIHQALGQNESDYWILHNGYAIDFRNAALITDDKYSFTEKGCNSVANINDEEGNLLFYTNAYEIFDADGNYIEGGKLLDDEEGTWCGGDTGDALIIKYPDQDQKYIVLFKHRPEQITSYYPDIDLKGSKVLHYRVVDMQQKKVTDEKGLIHGDIDNFFVNKSNSPDTLWLVMEPTSAPPNAYSYPITKNGIGEGIVSNNVKPKFVSPDGKKAATVIKPEYRIELYDFDLRTGRIKNKYIYSDRSSDRDNYYFDDMVFSPNSQHLFVLVHYFEQNSDSEIDHSELWSFNTNAPDEEEFIASKTMIHRFDNQVFENIRINPLKELMYVEQIDNNHRLVSALPFPDRCKNIGEPKLYFELSSEKGNNIPDPDKALPFVPNFHFSNEYTPPDYVPDTQSVCPEMHLAALELPGHKYNWHPSTYLDDPAVSNPKIEVEQPLFQDTIMYNLKVTDLDGCYHYDSTLTAILPYEEIDIIGPASVCPGSDSMQYWVETEIPLDSGHWTAEGGDIISGVNHDSLLINWGNTNLNAAVSHFSINRFGCKNQSDPLKVKIFKELDTETPKGADLLACDSLVEIYEVLPKHGSVFDWQINGGEILEGYGSHQIKVAWNDSIKFGQLWINESVNTDLEICFGRSDTLTVANPANFDTDNIILQSVSNSLQDTTVLSFNYDIQYPQYYSSSFRLQQKSGDTWLDLERLDPYQNQIALPVENKNQQIFDFRIRTQNLCDEDIASSIHQNIVLNCNSKEEKGIISLTWNEYTGWEDFDRYHIYSKNDDANYYPLGSTEINKYDAPTLFEGVNHDSYVEAINHSGFSALSNICKTTYTFPLWAPNVFTPNGDAHNQTFTIRNLEQHPENDLYIYNRRGNLLVHLHNYRNNWNGADMDAGIYFYHLTTHKFGHEIKGWLQILK